MTKFDLMVPCAIGIEKFLANEAKKLGYVPEGQEPGRIHIQTDREGMYRYIRSTRLAERVFLIAGSFAARDLDEFYQGVRNIRWQDLVPLNAVLHVEKVRVNEPTIKSTASLQARTQRAIADAIMRHHRVELMPEGGKTVSLRVYGRGNRYSIAVDLCGEALHKRGWRTKAGKAPIKETIAAAMLTANLWRRKTPLHDPFCGSGTIVLEALAFALDLAPGLWRPLAVDTLLIHDPATDRQVQDALASKVVWDHAFTLHGSDQDKEMVAIAQQNLESFIKTYRLGGAVEAKIRQAVHFYQKPLDAITPWSDEGLILCNPPFGERLEDAEKAQALYRTFTAVHQRFPRWAFSFISSSPDVASTLRRKTEFARRIHNGAMEMTVYRFAPLQDPVKVSSTHGEA